MRSVIRSLLVSLWFMALTFPLAVLKIAPKSGEIILRWHNCVYIGVGIFILSFVWRALLVKKGQSTPEEADLVWLFNWLEKPSNVNLAYALAFLVIGLAPIAFVLLSGAETAQGTVIATAIWAVLGILGAALSLTGRRGKTAGSVRNAASALTRPGLPRVAAILVVLCLIVPIPFFGNIYQTNVLTQAFIWVMLGLGLNIVVGQTGLLVLGYVAFYAVGAYTYAILNVHFGSAYFGFWICLPLGGLMAAIAGILLSLPVLRLRGDYLAIVTLGFGEIVRLVLESGSISFRFLAYIWMCIKNFSLEPLQSGLSQSTIEELPRWMTTPLDLKGPAGFSNIPYPSFFGRTLSIDNSVIFVFFIALAMMVLTIFAVARLRDSRLGRSWMALREDEIACEAMGVDKVKAKLTAFALGACWAGFGGVLFAAKLNYINPPCFTFMESALILSVVVLGGLGSILGVVLGALVLIVLPEYLRTFEEYRMLVFGGCMVLMMVFRPQGLLTPQRKERVINDENVRVTVKKEGA